MIFNLFLENSILYYKLHTLFNLNYLVLVPKMVTVHRYLTPSNVCNR